MGVPLHHCPRRLNRNKTGEEGKKQLLGCVKLPGRNTELYLIANLSCSLCFPVVIEQIPNKVSVMIQNNGH